MFCHNSFDGCCISMYLHAMRLERRSKGKYDNNLYKQIDNKSDVEKTG